MYVTPLHQKVSKQQSNAGIYRVPDSVRFNQVHITDVSGPVLVHLWHRHRPKGWWGIGCSGAMATMPLHEVVTMQLLFVMLPLRQVGNQKLVTK